jgi:superfamily II DNA or RNA helicase
MPIIAKITINDNRFFIFESKPSNISIIEKLFTYEDTSQCFIRGKFHKERIKYVNFVTKEDKNPTAALIPIGFLDELIRYLEKNKAKYKVIDKREIPAFTFEDEYIKNNLEYLELYNYQTEAIKVALEKGNGIIASSTGSGKTEMFISLCNLMGLRTLILFSSIDLAHQTRKRMEKAGIDSGLVQGPNIDENHQVVMATVQSSHKLQREDYQMIIVDEVHKANGEQYQQLLRRYDSRYRFGFSATPFIKSKKSQAKLRNARVKAWIGDEIYKVESKQLIENNTLAKPYIFLIPVNDVYDEKRDKSLDIFDWDWQFAENKGIIENSIRNQYIADIASQVKGQTLILIKRIDHGERLAEKIEDAVFLSGSNNSKERDEVIQRFEKGENFTLIASTIFDEGVDIKNLNNVIIASGGASYIKILQRIGRGMRKMKDKHRVDIYDFYDKTNHILLRHSKERIEIARKEGYTNISLKKHFST